MQVANNPHIKFIVNDFPPDVTFSISNNSDVKALKACLQLLPGTSNAPLFQFKMLNNWVPLTDSRVRAHLKDVLILCGKDPDFISFHSFRRSGATFAFDHNVPLQDIQRHGTWTSDCVWKYVTDSADSGGWGFLSFLISTFNYVTNTFCHL